MFVYQTDRFLKLYRKNQKKFQKQKLNEKFKSKMKQIRFLLASLALLLVCGTAQAQFGKRLGRAVENAAKNATVRKAEQKTDEAVSKGIDKATDPNTYKDKDGGESKDGQKSSSQKQSGNDAESESGESDDVQQDAPKGVKAAEMAYAKSDFVPGDEIFFEDLMDNEQLGEFPSMWDLKNGNAEIASKNGKKAIVRDPGQSSEIRPLMKDMKSYLPEKFTLEMDLWLTPKPGNQWYRMYFYDASGKQVMYIQFDNRVNYRLNWDYISTSGSRVEGNAKPAVTFDGWHHFAVSFNQRAFKIYLNGIRLGNIPNMVQPASFVYCDFPMNSASGGALTNVRFAKGAVPLYDRMMTDGKFITYGITFDVGKSTIKPESMGEINRIVTLMKENPDLKFSVEGHTDSTGGAASNQTLSEARSKAIVAKLVEMGIAPDRLQSAGKGQNTPIADNSTDEGRAKNRRVEFVKI
jgi:outer membrane protein OmpA-like peptidoglycan-associated protein